MTQNNQIKYPPVDEMVHEIYGGGTSLRVMQETEKVAHAWVEVNKRNEIEKHEQVTAETVDQAKACLAVALREKWAEKKGLLQTEKKPSALDVQVGGGHYKNKKIQPIEYAHANNLNCCEFSVVKHITRWREKGGKEDLLKVKHYVDLLIQLEGL